MLEIGEQVYREEKYLERNPESELKQNIENSIIIEYPVSQRQC